MGRKSKYSLDEKLHAIRYCLEGKGTANYYEKMSGISKSTIRDWIRNYQSAGIEGIIDAPSHSRHTAEKKTAAVKDYLAGDGSYHDICKKYSIRSTCQLRHWVLKYNGHKELKATGTGGAFDMTKGRKTTLAERVEIVEYCISCGMNYAEAASKYQVSYQQVYLWTKKYDSKGTDGLLDNRGKRNVGETMSEMEKLRAENKFLRAEKKRAMIEIEFLKKVEEVERRRY
jgi:transposase-like protein